MPKFTHKTLILLVLSGQLIFLVWGPGHSLLTSAIGSPTEFECRIADPYDPIRGSGITVDITASTVQLSPTQRISIGEHVYAIVATPSKGPSFITHVQTNRPWRTKTYIQAQVQTIYQQRNKNGQISRTAVLDLPITSVPVSSKNPIALQRALRELLKDKESDKPTLQLKIYRGRAVITDLKIAGIPLSQLSVQ